jgi:hypothetical protein
MAEQPRPDDLARLRARLDAQEAAFAAFRVRIERRERHRRLPRRFLPLALVTLLVALVPLGLLAANPTFSDLNNAASEHRSNIQAIGNVGVTTGFDDPNSSDPNARVYYPKDNVTREEMASFLARVAGLGTNPPVTNADKVDGRDASSFARVARAQNLQDSSEVGQPPFFISATYPTFEALVTVSLDAPTAGFVLVQGNVTAFSAPGTPVSVRLRDVSSGGPGVVLGETTSQPQFQYNNRPAGTVANPESGPEFVPGLSGSFSPTWVFQVRGAGTRSYALEITDDTADQYDSEHYSSTITALFVPFGPTGATTLGEGASGAENRPNNPAPRAHPYLR